MSLAFLDCFSRTYSEARRKFRAAVENTPARVQSHTLALKDPDGEYLATDVVRFGPANASKILMLTSGTHGVEGLCGSGCMIDWLRGMHWKSLPPDMAIVLVHFINPYGVAWRQRQTEENIDLNRNFVDHAGGNYRTNSLYDELHDALITAEPLTAAWDASVVELEALRNKHGLTLFNRAILGGQYVHSDGLFFGGKEPANAQRTILRILEEHCAAAGEVAIVDFHTGLGSYGYGVLGTSNWPGTAPYQRAAAWYSEKTITTQLDLIGNNTGAASTMGDMGSGLQKALPKAVLTYVALEYGTYGLARFVEVYRANCWMQKYGQRGNALGLKIADDFEEFFYPRCDVWKEMVIWRSRQVVRQAIDGLAAV